VFPLSLIASWSPALKEEHELQEVFGNNVPKKYRVFRAQADLTFTHTSHKDIEQSTTQASITLDGNTD
jgi:hypothetical protein